MEKFGLGLIAGIVVAMAVIILSGVTEEQITYVSLGIFLGVIVMSALGWAFGDEG